MAEPPTSQLQKNARDRVAAALRGVVGAAPIVGPALAELISEVIPNQRADRFEKFMIDVAERLQKLEGSSLNAKLGEPENIALFEEGAAQAVRAVSDERRSYISQIVTHGISGQEKERIEAKRLLDLIGEIDDDQVIILTSYLHKNLHNDEFYNKHSKILEPVIDDLGSNQEELDKATMYKLARSELTRLGLLRPHFQRPRRGELPEFDEKTGMMKASSYELTSVGRLLLVRIGLAEPGEF